MISDYQLRKLASRNSRANRRTLTAAIKKEAAKAEKRIAKLRAYQTKVGEIRGHSYALDRLEGAMKSLDIRRLNSLKSRQNSSLARQLSALQEFNTSVTSTPTGIRRQERLLRKNIKEAGLSVARGENWNRMIEIFSSEAFAEFETFGSPRRFAIAYEAAKRKVTDEDLEKIMDDYRKGASLDKAWYDTAGFKPLLL